VHVNVRHEKFAFAPNEELSSFLVMLHWVAAFLAVEDIETMRDILILLGKQTLICSTLDNGATVLQGKQVINMMACVPKQRMFLDHFMMDCYIPTQIRVELVSL
jgi:hypothetical protein